MQVMVSGADPGLSFGGRGRGRGEGGGQKYMCALAHHKGEACSPIPYGLEALGVFDVLSIYLSLIFKHSDTKLY